MMELSERFSRMYLYASLGRDTDLNNQTFQNIFTKVQKLASEFSSATSYFTPEVLEIPKEKVDKFIKEEKSLASFKQYFDVMFRGKSHTLTGAEEKLLAELSPIFSIPNNTYGTLNDAELPFPTIKDENGQDVQVSHGRYRSGLYSQNRNYRRDVYKATYVPYEQLIQTMATLYNGRVTMRTTFAKIRKYNSALESVLFENDIPISVYENLIKVTNDNLKTLHRWASIKKKVLKLDELHPYDTYVSLFPSIDRKYTYEEAMQLSLEALKPMGKEYIEAVKRGFENRWIDVYETQAKRSGAYSNSSGAGPHPFILLNWNNTLDDVFTLVHEIGHNMHSFFTEKTQPFQYRDYSTFVAEVASTANESLLFDYMIKNAKSKEEKLFLIEKFLTQVQATFFRQTQFAEFEKRVHEQAEKGIYLTDKQLSEDFIKDYQKYWGPEMVTDPEEGYSWARVHHLIKYNFYVYQYATGIACSSALVDNILKEGQPAIDRYIGFLSAGNSDYPINILKKAGVDMSKPDAILALIKKTNEYLDELEKTLK
jgi:oligoendopeptidase F